MKPAIFAAAILAANEMQPLPEYREGAAGVFAANESSFDSAYYDEPLTNFLVGGWDKDPLMMLLDFYAPAVPVARQFHYKTYDHKDDFWRDEGDEDIRPMGGKFRETQDSKRGNVKETTDNKGFVVCLDKDELAGDPGKEQREVRKLQRRLFRNELRRALAVLVAAATEVTPTWDPTADPLADPDMYLREQLTTSENDVGLRPNRLGFGSLSWDYRMAVIRKLNNAGGYASGAMTPAELASFMMVETMVWGEARYRSAADTLGLYMGNKVLMFNASDGVTEEDPSNIKRFVSMTEGGTPMRVYRDDSHPKLVEITVEHYSSLKLTSSLGIRLATVSNS